MTLVDTSVWVDRMRDRDTPQVAALETLLARGEVFCTCGLVVTEVLQGITNQKAYIQTKSDFDSLDWFDLNHSTFQLGAAIYRELRRHGLTVRGTIDCLIAAVVVENKLRLLATDRDYVNIGRHYPLRLI